MLIFQNKLPQFIRLSIICLTLMNSLMVILSNAHSRETKIISVSSYEERNSSLTLNDTIVPLRYAQANVSLAMHGDESLDKVREFKPGDILIYNSNTSQAGNSLFLGENMDDNEAKIIDIDIQTIAFDLTELGKRFSKAKKSFFQNMKSNQTQQEQKQQKQQEQQLCILGYIEKFDLLIGSCDGGRSFKILEKIDDPLNLTIPGSIILSWTNANRTIGNKNTSEDHHHLQRNLGFFDGLLDVIITMAPAIVGAAIGCVALPGVGCAAGAASGSEVGSQAKLEVGEDQG